MGKLTLERVFSQKYMGLPLSCPVGGGGGHLREMASGRVTTSKGIQKSFQRRRLVIHFGEQIGLAKITRTGSACLNVLINT